MAPSAEGSGLHGRSAKVCDGFRISRSQLFAAEWHLTHAWHKPLHGTLTSCLEGLMWWMLKGLQGFALDAAARVSGLSNRDRSSSSGSSCSHSKASAFRVPAAAVAPRRAACPAAASVRGSPGWPPGFVSFLFLGGAQLQAWMDASFPVAGPLFRKSALITCSVM